MWFAWACGREHSSHMATLAKNSSETRGRYLLSRHGIPDPSDPGLMRAVCSVTSLSPPTALSSSSSSSSSSSLDHSTFFCFSLGVFCMFCGNSTQLCLKPEPNLNLLFDCDFLGLSHTTSILTHHGTVGRLLNVWEQNDPSCVMHMSSCLMTSWLMGNMYGWTWLVWGGQKQSNTRCI